MTHKITKFDFQSLGTKKFQKELEYAIKVVAEKYGLSFAPGSVRYSNTSYNTKIQITTTETPDGKEYSKQVDEWNKYSVWAGMPREWLNKTFRSGHRVLKIVGWNDRKRKNKVMLEEEYSGKPFMAPVNFVKNCMAKE